MNFKLALKNKNNEEKKMKNRAMNFQREDLNVTKRCWVP